MPSQNIPYNNKQLLKWSCFRIEKSDDTKKSYELIPTLLLDLVKQVGYEKFRNRFNWLYNNYSTENYELVWSELQAFNERRKLKFIQDKIIAKADEVLSWQVANLKVHFGDTPAWIEKLTDNQRQLLLDRARTCYGLEPEEIQLSTKTIYTVPERLVKEFNEELGTNVYWSEEELAKDRRQQITTNVYNDVVGRFKFYSKELQRLAENAVIRDARWMAQFNDTAFDLREHREIEGDEASNKMVPITDMQGPDSPYGLEIEFRDFLEPIYEDEGL